MLNELLKMKKDLELKGYSQNTIEAYLLYNKLFSQYYQTPPTQLSIDDVRNYLHYLITRKKCSSSYVNVDIFHIQQPLGHASLKTTARYIHLTRKNILNIKSPLDIIMECVTND